MKSLVNSVPVAYGFFVEPVTQESLFAVTDGRKVDQARVRVAKDDTSLVDLRNEPLQLSDKLGDFWLRRPRIAVAPGRLVQSSPYLAEFRAGVLYALQPGSDIRKDLQSFFKSEVPLEVVLPAFARHWIVPASII